MQISFYPVRILIFISFCLFFSSCSSEEKNKRIIHTDKAPEAIGPYSQAVEIENTIYLSGQIPIDPGSGRIVEEEIKGQTHQVIKNISAILHEAGYTLDDVVQCQIFLEDLDDYGEMNAVYSSYFKNDFPARAVVEVSSIPRDALIEMMVVAKK